MIYPGRASVAYSYGLSTEHDNRISRVQSQDGVSRFDYLGLDNVVTYTRFQREAQCLAVGCAGSRSL